MNVGQKFCRNTSVLNVEFAWGQHRELWTESEQGGGDARGAGGCARAGGVVAGRQGMRWRVGVEHGRAGGRACVGARALCTGWRACAGVVQGQARHARNTGLLVGRQGMRWRAGAVHGLAAWAGYRVRCTGWRACAGSRVRYMGWLVPWASVYSAWGLQLTKDV